MARWPLSGWRSLPSDSSYPLAFPSLAHVHPPAIPCCLGFSVHFCTSRRSSGLFLLPRMPSPPFSASSSLAPYHSAQTPFPTKTSEDHHTGQTHHTWLITSPEVSKTSTNGQIFLLGICVHWVDSSPGTKPMLSQPWSDGDGPKIKFQRPDFWSKDFKEKSKTFLSLQPPHPEITPSQIQRAGTLLHTHLAWLTTGPSLIHSQMAPHIPLLCPMHLWLFLDQSKFKPKTPYILYLISGFQSEGWFFLAERKDHMIKDLNPQAWGDCPASSGASNHRLSYRSPYSWNRRGFITSHIRLF